MVKLKKTNPKSIKRTRLLTLIMDLDLPTKTQLEISRKFKDLPDEEKEILAEQFYKILISERHLEERIKEILQR